MRTEVEQRLWARREEARCEGLLTEDVEEELARGPVPQFEGQWYGGEGGF